MVREALTSESLAAMRPVEAAACFLARRAEGLSPHEEALFAAWLAKDDGHKHALAAADRAWQAFAVAADDEILAAMRAHARALRPRNSAWTGWRPAAAAAVVILVAGAGLRFAPIWTHRGLTPPQRPAAGPAAGAAVQYASARGQPQDFTLPDGSTMTLDADSAVAGHFAGKIRAVELTRGRAFFAIAHDPTRPFTVTAGERRVVDIGTRFDVDLAAGTLTVRLLEGRVTVGPLNPAAPPVTLKPGQQYVERLGRASIRTIGEPGQEEVGWRKGLVDFDDQPLAEAAAVMNRYSQVQILIHDAKVGRLRVSGQFRAGQTDRFAETLAEIHGLRTVRRGGEIELVSKK